MRTQIYVENTKLDLFDDIDTSFTYAIDDVKDFGSKNTSFSKTVVIPGNQVNNKVFGHVFNMGSSNLYNSASANIGYNFNPMVSAKCVVLVDNIQVFKGSLRLTEIIDTDGEIEYTCYIFGELGGFINQLGNRRLEDLDFSAYDTVWSYANIIASWDTIAGSGVTFPLVDYGELSTNKIDFQYKAFRPALFVREYLEKIISATTYTVTSNFFNESLFDRLAICHNQKTLQASNTGVLSLIAASQSDFDNITYNMVWTTVTLGAFTTSDNITFTYGGASSVVLNLSIFVVIEDYTGYPDPVTIQVRKNGATINSLTVTELGVQYDLSVNGVTFAPTDTISVRVTSIALTNTITVSGNFDATAAAAILTPVLLGDAIRVNDTIPKGIFQRDFFIWILKYFNLYVYETAFDENKILIEPYVDFYPPNAENAIDYSKKVDRSAPIISSPLSELNARFYQYKFKEDNDFYNENYRKAYNEGYGERIYDTEFEFSKDTDVLEVGFANSILYQNTGTDKVYQAIYKLSGTTETAMDHVFRFSQLKKMTCTSYNILNGATVLGSPTTYLYAGHVNDPVTPTNDLNFGAPKQLQFSPTGYPTANIFNSYHSAYIAEITDKDSKLITLRVYLTAVDIMQLDFSKLIWLDGVLFRLNKIKNYNPIDLGTTEVELLKVIDL